MKDDFYSTQYGGFNEEADDVDFQAPAHLVRHAGSHEVIEDDDEVDSDFSIDENDEPKSDLDEEAETKKAKRGQGVQTKAYREPVKRVEKAAVVDPAAKKARQAQRIQSQIKRQWQKQMVLTDFGRKEARASTVSKTAETQNRQKEREHRARKLLRQRMRAREKKKANEREPTQAELLAEAKLTERLNIATLKKYEEMELEARKKATCCTAKADVRYSSQYGGGLVVRCYAPHHPAPTASTGQSVASAEWATVSLTSATKAPSVAQLIQNPSLPNTPVIGGVSVGGTNLNHQQGTVQTVKIGNHHMASLLNEEEKALMKDDFYSTQYGGFNEEADDVDFQAPAHLVRHAGSHEVIEDDDEVDSDFSIDENDEPKSDLDEEAETKKAKRGQGVQTKAYREPQKMCPITRLPAKYFDPATRLPYANLHAFRILREAYYSQLEQKGNKNDPEVKAWLDWRQKHRPTKPTLLTQGITAQGLAAGQQILRTQTGLTQQPQTRLQQPTIAIHRPSGSVVVTSGSNHIPTTFAVAVASQPQTLRATNQGIAIQHSSSNNPLRTVGNVVSTGGGQQIVVAQPGGQGRIARQIVMSQAGGTPVRGQILQVTNQAGGHQFVVSTNAGGQYLINQQHQPTSKP
eukprot:TCALIF_03283-PA protein Name:"Similar to YL-1 Vacuolar protein sorting-associated protein 72 homolog (Drosophila melanogaster)" AED:0.30 eAED:0.32 QI:0/0/0/0.6/0.75/0.6/5/0/631